MSGSDLPPPGLDLEKFFGECVDEMLDRNAEHHQLWGLGQEQGWQLDQERALLRLKFADGRTVEVEPQVVGLLRTVTGRWLWAWADRSIDTGLRQDVNRIREWGDRWGVEPLVEPSFSGDEEDAWTLTALTFHLLAADGAYRAVTGDLQIYMVFRLLDTDAERDDD
jgi:hypothetical protein